MEQFNDKKNSMETVEEIPLIDILYKDTYRIDSYLAQLLNGTLRSIKEQETTLQGASLSGKLDLKFLQAESNGKGSAGNLIEHDIDPHDRNVLSFLEILDLSPVRALHQVPTGCSCICKAIFVSETIKFLVNWYKPLKKIKACSLCQPITSRGFHPILMY